MLFLFLIIDDLESMRYPREISFEKYKAFREPFSIKLRPLTLIFGKNSSGKTSLCKLVSMMSQCMSGTPGMLLPLSDGPVKYGNNYTNLFHNHLLTGLTFGVVYGNGVAVEAEYFIDRDTLDVYRYQVSDQRSGQTVSIKKDNKDVEIPLRGMVYDELLLRLGISPDSLRFSTSYIGPVRKCLTDSLITTDAMKAGTVGYDGVGAYGMLLKSWLGDKRLFNEVSSWIYDHLEQQQLEIKPVVELPGFYRLNVLHNGVSCPIDEVGQGVSQILPIVTDAFAGSSDISVIEQAVLHLHPACHADVTAMLGLEARKAGRCCVVESHSENVLLGVRNLVTDPESEFGKDDVMIYFVDSDDDGTFLREITIDDSGELSEWPEGVFGEGFELVKNIIRNRKASS